MSESASGTDKKESTNETNVEIPGSSVACEVCNEKEEVRIVLRQCGHVVCLPCALNYIKHKIILAGHPRFKCPTSSCNEIVHENDINALLDEKEPSLERYMTIQHRRYLQYKQNKHSITAALPSGNIKRCPLCRSIYHHEPGCNYVICANSACSTAFCWQCEKPIGRPITHFTTFSICRLGYTDYERLFRAVQLVLDVNALMLWIFLPFVYLISLLYLPLLILFMTPVSLAYEGYRAEREKHDFLLPVDYGIIMFKILVGIVFGGIAGIPLALGSVISGFVLIGVYVAFLIVRLIPCGLTGDRVNTVLCMIRWAGRLFKIGPYATLLNDARRERREAMVKLEENRDDFELEKNDSITTNKETEKSSVSELPTTSNVTSTAEVRKVSEIPRMSEK